MRRHQHVLQPTPPPPHHTADILFSISQNDADSMRLIPHWDYIRVGHSLISGELDLFQKRGLSVKWTR